MKLLVPMKGALIKLVDTFEATNPVGAVTKFAKMEATLPLGKPQIINMAQGDSFGQTVEGVLQVGTVTLFKWFILSMFLESLRVRGQDELPR